MAPGVRRRLDAADAFTADLRAWSRALPNGCAFTGLTAARLHGLWLPPVPEEAPIFLAAPGEVRVRREQVRLVRHPAPFVTEEIDGLPVTTLPLTLIACAREVAVLDLVVLADSAQRQLGGLAELVAASRLRRRGAPALRRALTLTDIRAESPWESLLRVLHVTAGVPVTPQADLLDAHGTFVGRADLLVTGTRTVQEYDGAVHLELGQFVSDRRREGRLLESGYRRYGYTSDDVIRRASTILRHADEALGRIHEPGRLTEWHRLLRASLFSPSGRAAASRRWHGRQQAA